MEFIERSKLYNTKPQNLWACGVGWSVSFEDSSRGVLMKVGVRPCNPCNWSTVILPLNALMHPPWNHSSSCFFTLSFHVPFMHSSGEWFMPIWSGLKRLENGSWMIMGFEHVMLTYWIKKNWTPSNVPAEQKRKRMPGERRLIYYQYKAPMHFIMETLSGGLHRQVQY